MAAKVTKDLGVRLTADVKDLRRKLKSLEKDWDRYGRQVQKTNQKAAAGRATMGGAVGGAGGMMRRGGASLIAGGAAIAGSLGFVAALKQAKDFESQLVDITMAGKENRAWMNNLRSSTLKLSEQWGKTPEDIAAGVGRIITETGKADLAAQSIDLLTKASYAAGSSVEELAGVGIYLQTKLGLGPEKWSEAFGILAAQANEGAIELKDMATHLPTVLNMASDFGHKGMGALRDYGALFQIAKRSNTSAAETATSVARMQDQIIAKQGKIEKTLGIDLTKNGKFLALGDMLRLIVSQMEKLGIAGKDARGKKFNANQFFGSTFMVRGKKAITDLRRQFRAGFGKTTDAGMSFTQLSGLSGVGAIEEMAQRRKGLSPIDKWNKAAAKLRVEMHKHMLPLLEKLSELMPDIAKAAKFALDNTETLFALWLGAKASKFFGQFIQVGRAMSGGSGSAAGAGAATGAGGLGGMRLGRRGSARADGESPDGKPGFYARNRGRIGLGLGVAGAIGGIGAAVKGGGVGRYADMGAAAAMGLGGIPGMAAGAGYFAAKAIFHVAKAELYSDAMEFGDEKGDLKFSELLANISESAMRKGRDIKGRKIATTPEEQAAADRRAIALAKAKAQKAGLLGEYDASTRKKIVAAAKIAGAAPSEEEISKGLAEANFGMGPEAETIAEIRSKATLASQEANVAAVIDLNDTIKKLTKATEKSAARGISISQDAAKAIAKIAQAEVRAASKKGPST